MKYCLNFTGRNYHVVIPINKHFYIRKYGAVVQHWIEMQKVASSSLLGAVFAMNRENFSYIIGKGLSVRIFYPTQESNIIGKSLSAHHSGSKNQL